MDGTGPAPDGGEELIPCPTCWLPADLLAPGAYESFPHSRCARGHDNTLIPAVLTHLRSIRDNAFPQSA